MQFQIPKGLFDILPYGEDQLWRLVDYWQYVEKIVRKIALDYSFKEIRTPIFERTQVFTQTSGETSDIVTKEMYTFLDKAKRSMTLRPEGTAVFIRAFVENNMQEKSVFNKFFYIAPMFRYDRPQKGRYRQHHQFGVEAIGIESFEQDFEVIDMLMQLYSRLGLKNIFLHINSVGDLESREKYKKALKEFLKPHLEKLSTESKQRFEKNPLRILDSKEKEDIKILKEAPSILDFLNEHSKKHFEGLLNLLEKFQIPYQINKNLVRGLDYYNHTVFEVVSESEGSQNALGGGGRYDGLIKKFSKKDLPAIGFGTGIERIIQTMIKQNIEPKTKDFLFVYFVFLDEISKNLCIELMTKLRHLKISSDMGFKSKNIKKAMKIASNLKAKYSVIIGEEERKSKTFIIKNMETREQETKDLKDFDFHIKKLFKGQKNV